VSVVGSQAANIGLIALIYQRTHHSGSWLAAALVADYATRVVCTPWAGAISDRLDRRTVMVVSSLGAAAAFVGLAFAHSPWLIVALAAVTSAAEAPFGPASGALIGALVPADDRGWANSLRSMAGSSGMLIGAFFGGAMVAAVGPSIAFIANAASFLVAAALIASVRGRFRAQPGIGTGAAGMGSGFRLLRVTPALSICTAVIALSLLAVGMINVVEYPLFVSLGAGSAAFGIAVASWAAGQLIGARLARRLSTPKGERRALTSGLFLTAVGIGAAGVIPSVVLVTAVFALGGVGYSLASVAAVGVLQRWSPDATRGRVFAAYTGIQQAMMGTSLCTGGVLLAALSPSRICLLAGALGIAASALALRMPPRSPGLLRPPTLRALPPVPRRDTQPREAVAI
jgi:MFS family permease